MFFHYSNGYLVSVRYVSGTVIGPGAIAVKKIKFPVLGGAC